MNKYKLKFSWLINYQFSNIYLWLKLYQLSLFLCMSFCNFASWSLPILYYLLLLSIFNFWFMSLLDTNGFFMPFYLSSSFICFFAYIFRWIYFIWFNSPLLFPTYSFNFYFCPSFNFFILRLLLSIFWPSFNSLFFMSYKKS